MTSLVKGLDPGRAVLGAALVSAALAALLFQGLAGGLSFVSARAHAGASAQGDVASLSLSAQAAMSESLGAEDPAYRVSASAAGFRVLNPAQHLHARFSAAGVQLSSGKLDAGLSLHAVGYGDSVIGLGDTRPQASANRVVYTRAGISEWYVNGPMGLEQGFTIARAPSAPSSAAPSHRTDPLTLSMGLSGNGRATLAPGGHSLALTRGDTTLRYGGLSAKDASGRTLRTWLQLQAGELELRVDARGARFPLRIDPLVQRRDRLTSEETTSPAEPVPSEFGFSVAVSSDGDIALIGGPDDAHGTGAAWVFTRSGEDWTKQAKLTVSEEQREECIEETEEGGEEAGGCGFGYSVALSSSGETALIGGPRNHDNVGAAWVFTREPGGTKWSQQGPKLTGGAEEGSEARFGRSVALSSDGNTALIGGPRDVSVVPKQGAQEKGAAWVFVRPPKGTTWSQQGPKLTGIGEERGHGHFGRTVTLSTDGNTALIGAPLDQVGQGGVWAYTRSAGAWIQQGHRLTPDNETPPGRFGRGLALSANGNTALIGGRVDNGEQGAAWVYTRSGESWQQGEKLTKPDMAGEEAKETPIAVFGFSVALSADGNTALIGGPRNNQFEGGAWVFTHSGSKWSAGEKLNGTEEQGHKGAFGESVALSADGETALVGGPRINIKEGGVWAFTNSEPVAPVNVNPPSIEGIAEVGQPLTCSEGFWSGNPKPTAEDFSYQWLRDGIPIAGQTGTGYVVLEADRGHTLTCAVTATTSVAPAATAVSAGLAIPPPPPPVVTQPAQQPSAIGGVLSAKVAVVGPAAPIYGKTATLHKVSGTIMIELPGTNKFIPLSAAKSVPLGTIINATNGKVELTSTADTTGKTDQHGVFYGGIFRITQIKARSGVHGGRLVVITVLTLVGPLPTPCFKLSAGHGAAVATAHRRRTVRKLWGEAKGNFRSSAHYASATVRGTKWLTEDTCAGTLVRVVHGLISVADFAHHRTFLLKAHHSFVSHPGKGG